jgi:hypothetical protein
MKTEFLTSRPMTGVEVQRLGVSGLLQPELRRAVSIDTVGPVGGSGTLAEPCKAQSERINELGVALKLRFAPAGCSLGTSGRKV